MDESIILYSHLYFKYLQIKLMKEEKIIRVCECIGKCTFEHKPKAFAYTCINRYIYIYLYIYICAHGIMYNFIISSPNYLSTFLSWITIIVKYLGNSHDPLKFTKIIMHIPFDCYLLLCILCKSCFVYSMID